MITMLFVMFSRSAVNAPQAHKSDRASADWKFRSKSAVRLTALRLAPSPDTRNLHRLTWRHSRQAHFHVIRENLPAADLDRLMTE